MGIFHRTDTRELTGSAFQVSPPRRRGRALCAVLTLVLLGGLAVGGLKYFETHLAPAQRVIALERDNAGLRQAAEEARMALQMERATRGELERQVSELNQQVQQLSAELGFLREQGRRR